MTTRGADLVVQALAERGVRQLFSLSGNQILPVYDATIGRDLRIIHTRHEAAAVHMADGWGRLCEEPGVALVTAGPGHLNALSALYGALMAESPLVLLSGHAPAAQAGRGAFQEIDQAGAAAPVTKASWVAKDAARLGEDMALALELARSGRPGPVHVSLPGDLLDAKVSNGSAVVMDGARHSMTVADADLRRLRELLEASRRPIVLLGPAMARAARRAAVERLTGPTGIPALPMESPRGVNDPWLDIAVRFGGAPSFSPSCRFVQVDWDAGALDQSGRVSLGLVTDPAHLATRLAAEEASLAGRWREWGAEVSNARATVPAEWDALRRSARTPVHPLRVCAALQPLLDRGGILVADGGEFGQWIQAGCEAGTRMINGLSGSIGSAVPLALAAKLRHPDRTVIAALGDGTFGFHGFELDTAVREGLPVLVVVGNDARWNAEHQLQLQHYGAERTVGCELRPTRYDLTTAALGGYGEHVERPGDLAPALERALASGLPACVNVMIDGVAAPTYAAAKTSSH